MPSCALHPTVGSRGHSGPAASPSSQPRAPRPSCVGGFLLDFHSFAVVQLTFQIQPLSFHLYVHVLTTACLFMAQSQLILSTSQTLLPLIQFSSLSLPILRVFIVFAYFITHFLLQSTLLASTLRVVSLVSSLPCLLCLSARFTCLRLQFMYFVRFDLQFKSFPFTLFCLL